MTVIEPGDIEASAQRIETHVRRTPMLNLRHGLSPEFELILKLEHLQVTGSFKTRGAFSVLTSVDVPEAGVVAASGGNFGIAVAHAASRLGHNATIFVPATSPREKIGRIDGYGADVRVVPGYYDHAREESESFAERSGAFQAHAYDQHQVVCGQGTLAMEMEQDSDFDVVIAAVGGGGLVAGIASWLRGRKLVVAAEPTRCRSFHAALEAGGPVEVEVAGVAASSLGARAVGNHLWEARQWIGDAVLVDDDAIIDAQRWLWATTRLVVEPAAATGLAVLRSGAFVPDPGSRIVVVLSGGNVDPATVV